MFKRSRSVVASQWFIMALGLFLSLLGTRTASAQQTQLKENSIIERLAEVVAENQKLKDDQTNQNGLMAGPEHWISPKGISGSLQILLLLTVLSLAPALLLMTTCYVRVIVVFGLLRQALGTAQLPPSQVVTSISLFITLFVMTPVWNKVYVDAIQPYTTPGSNMTAQQAFDAGAKPIREFMMNQIVMAQNYDDVAMFYSKYKPNSEMPQFMDEVPIQVLLPAYMLSELKTAFIMGFAIYLPFLILDIVIASITISMGMMMLPPAIISTPFKLLLFVLVDGWRLVVNMLIDSFGTFGT
jgi:flagellar biosynthetic protein FliP